MGSDATNFSAFILKLIRTSVGVEDSIVTESVQKGVNSAFYKVFGKYDILEVSKLVDLHSAFPPINDTRILDLNALPCFSWGSDIEQIWADIEGAIAPAVILLKLDERVFSDFGLKGLIKIVDYLSKPEKKTWGFFGMGYHELLLWYSGDNFEEIFDYAAYVRALTASHIFGDAGQFITSKLFFETTTIPLVSYKAVITAKDWKKVTGKVSPLVKVRCTPGYESAVAGTWDIGWNNLLGSEDLISNATAKFEAGEFLRQLIDFRKECAELSPVFNTCTHLLKEKEKSEIDKIIGSRLDKRTEFPLFHIINEIWDETGTNQFLIGSLSNVINILNFQIKEGGIAKNFSDIVFSINSFLLELLQAYKVLVIKNDVADIEKKLRLESLIFKFLNCAYQAVIQHLPVKDFGDISDINLRPTFACSINQIIQAISLIPEFLFQAIQESSPPLSLASEFHFEEKPKVGLAGKAFNDYYSPWKGFVVFGLTEGYQVVNQGEIIYAPYKDIFKVLNWITFSHEISHAYYTRICFPIIEKDYLEKSTSVIPRTSKYDIENAIKYYQSSTSEFFAHWFDFKHFFDSETPFYLWSIWRTWLNISRIYQVKSDYWLRSLFIIFCSNWQKRKLQFKDIYQTYKYEPDRNAKFMEIFKEDLNWLDYFLSDKFPDSMRNILLSSEERDALLEKMLAFYDLCRVFEENYINYDLLRVINSRPATITDDIDKLTKGQLLEHGIKNPFLFLKELLRTIFEGEAVDLNDEVKVALILSFWETSRKFTRVQE